MQKKKIPKKIASVVGGCDASGVGLDGVGDVFAGVGVGSDIITNVTFFFDRFFLLFWIRILPYKIPVIGDRCDGVGNASSAGLDSVGVGLDTVVHLLHVIHLKLVG